jgi:CubicO group peptidase (beta-lactamase class C family)
MTIGLLKGGERPFQRVRGKGGFWDGQQIIPKAWIEESTKVQIKISGSSFDTNYGYQGLVSPDGFAAVGFEGQFMVISPENNLVVVLNSSLLGSKAEKAINSWKTYLLPAIQTLGPLPANEKATANLKSEIERFEKYEVE